MEPELLICLIINFCVSFHCGTMILKEKHIRVLGPRRMPPAVSRPNACTFNASLSACENASAWQKADDLQVSLAAREQKYKIHQNTNMLSTDTGTCLWHWVRLVLEIFTPRKMNMPKNNPMTWFRCPGPGLGLTLCQYHGQVVLQQSIFQ